MPAARSRVDRPLPALVAILSLLAAISLVLALLPAPRATGPVARRVQAQDPAPKPGLTASGPLLAAGERPERRP